MKIRLLLGLLALLPAAALADGPGVLKFDELSFEVSEDAGVALIRVERSQGEDGAVSVQYSTSNGSAVAGQDYTAVSGTLSWGDGDESDRTIQVPIANDAAAEGLDGAARMSALEAEAASAGIALLGHLGDRVQGLRGELQLSAFHVE